MAVVKKICYTVKCDLSDCDNICCKLEDYVGPLDALNITKESAEEFAKEHGFIQLSARKWICPDCAKKYGYMIKG